MTYSDRRKQVHNGTNDIISGLPINIIDSILDFMPMRDAARTSILSRNWRYIWASHPKLVLDKDFFLKTFETNCSLNLITSHHRFERLINKLLSNHLGPILKFSLYVPKAYFVQTGLIDQWMLFLSRSGIKELTIDNEDDIPYQLPSYISSCVELNYLTICNCVFKRPHLSEGFRNLSRLTLKRISFTATSFGTLAMLEWLTFDTCRGINQVKVNAPKLAVLFVLDSYEVESICFRNFPKLEVVVIRRGKEVKRSGQGESTSLINFFGDLPRVMVICFDGFFLKFLAAGTVPKRLPTTANHLQYLILHNLEVNDVDQISRTLSLLRSCPNLKTLQIFTRQAAATTGDASHYLEAPDSMNQILNKLRTVRIFSSKGSWPELLFIKILLACSPSLEKFFIERNKEVDASEGFRISRQLLLFHRASKKAELIYLDPGQLVPENMFFIRFRRT